MSARAAKIALLAASLAPGALIWREGPPLPVPLGGGAVAVLGYDLVIAGGNGWQNGKKLWYREVQIYGLRNGRWRSGPPLPVPVAEAAFAASAAGLDVLGGSDGSRCYDRHWRLDPAKAAWKELGLLPEPRMYAAALRLGSTIYLLGGATDADMAHSTGTLFARDESAARPAWRKLAPIPGGGRSLHAAAAARGRLFVFGGCSGKPDGTLSNLGDAWAYDPAPDHWQKLRDLPRPMRMLSAVVFEDRYVYLFGGYFATEEQARREAPGFGFSDGVLVYDIAQDRYTPLSTPMPVRVAGPLVARQGAVFYVVGGEDRNYSRSGRLLIGEVRRQ